jgi:hypothetical protein
MFLLDLFISEGAAEVEMEDVCGDCSVSPIVLL